MNAETFNALYEVGVPVFAYPGARPEVDAKGRRLVTRTRSRASVLGGHTDVVWVDGHSACIALTHVDVVGEDEFNAAELADTVAREGALPVPVGPKPPVDDDRAKAPWGRGEDGRPLLPMGAHWTDVPELVDREVAGIQSRVDQAQSGRWYVPPTGAVPGTVCTQYDGYTRTVGQFSNMLPADLELVLHAHDDLRWCLDMIAKFRSRVAELETELRTANEGLSDAAEALRADRCPCPPASRPHQVGCPLDGVPDAVTRVFAPVASLREDAPLRGGARLDASAAVAAEATHWKRLGVEDPHDSPLHHPYRVSHDMPETGGTR